MRHRVKGYKLGRTAAHRKATLTALSNALIQHKRITTTFTKAKALRMYVEPVINRAKEDTTHNRRQAFRRLGDKEAVKTLFGEIADALGDRQGGYTRVVKLGRRSGDGAEMAVIELVDFNDVKPEGTGGTSRRRKTRRGGGGGRRRSKAAETAATAPVAAEEVADAVVAVEDVEEAEQEEQAEAAAEVQEEEVQEEPVAEEETVEEPVAEVEAEAEAEATEDGEPEDEDTAEDEDEEKADA